MAGDVEQLFSINLMGLLFKCFIASRDDKGVPWVPAYPEPPDNKSSQILAVLGNINFCTFILLKLRSLIR